MMLAQGKQLESLLQGKIREGDKKEPPPEEL